MGLIQAAAVLCEQLHGFLGGALWHFQALPQTNSMHAPPPPLLPGRLQGAVTALRGAANTEAAAGEGRLDGALARLAAVMDPGFAGGRLEALELLTAVLQVGRQGVLTC